MQPRLACLLVALVIFSACSQPPEPPAAIPATTGAEATGPAETKERKETAKAEEAKEAATAKESAPTPVQQPTAPQGSQEAAPVDYSATELPVDRLDQPPDLVVKLTQTRTSEQGTGPKSEFFGYYIEGDRFVPLSRSTGALNGLWPALSSDGQWLAYGRYAGKHAPVVGLCVRHVTGGEPFCYWLEKAADMGPPMWRPHSQELIVAGQRVAGGKPPAPRAFRLGADGLVAHPAPPRVGPFSPDGRWMFIRDQEKAWVVNLESGDTREIAEGGAVWVGSAHLVFIRRDIEARTSELILAGLDGKVTPAGPPPKEANYVISLHPDPSGRAVAVNDGMLMSVTKWMGASLYDLKTGSWSVLPGTFVAGWLQAGGSLVMKDGQKWFLYDWQSQVRTEIRAEIPGHYVGSSGDGSWLAFLDGNGPEPFYLYHVETGELRRPRLEDRWISDPIWVQPPKE